MVLIFSMLSFVCHGLKDDTSHTSNLADLNSKCHERYYYLCSTLINQSISLFVWLLELNLNNVQILHLLSRRITFYKQIKYHEMSRSFLCITVVK